MEMETPRQLASSLGERWRALVAVGLIALATLLAYVLFPRERTEEIRDLPSSERAALVARTVTTLRTTCARAAGPDLASYCAEQAAVIAPLPECDASCRELAARFIPKPTR
jgi:hypothetical protein